MTDNLLKMMKRNPATIGLAREIPITLGEPAPSGGFYTLAIFHTQMSKLGPYLHLLKCLFAGAAAGTAGESNTFTFFLFTPSVAASIATGVLLGLEWVTVESSSSFPPVFQVFCCRAQKDVGFFFFSAPPPGERKEAGVCVASPAELRVSLLTCLSARLCKISLLSYFREALRAAVHNARPGTREISFSGR